MKESLVKTVWGDSEHLFSPASVKFDKELIARAIANVFTIGPYHYFVIDFADPEALDMFCPNTSDFLDADKEDFSVDFIMRYIHPDDIAYVRACEQRIIAFAESQTVKENILKYKFIYQFRFKYKGQYRLLLHQSIILSIDGFGRICKAVNIHTIIDHISTTNNEKLSFIGLNGAPSYWSMDVLAEDEECSINELESFSSRELEMIRCFAEGMTSKQVADFLNISVHTVRTHRKNILSKTDCPNMIALATKCVREGLI